MDAEDWGKECYEIGKYESENLARRLDRNRLTSVWLNQQECYLKGIIMLVKE
jgi:hypothetical protein